MNKKRYLVGSIVTWVFIFVYEMIFHGVIMKGPYQQIANLMRPEEAMMALFFWMILAQLIMAFGFCYVFIKGYENRGIAEGFRYGLIIWVAFGISSLLIEYVVYPIPARFIVIWAIGYFVELVVSGLIIAAIYRPRAA